MNATKIIIITAIAMVVAGVGLGAYYYYTQMPQPVDEMSLRVYADPMAENLLQSINEANRTSFFRDLDATMKAVMTEEYFSGMCSNIQQKVGNYTSKTFVRGEAFQGFISAYYSANFTGEPAGVTVKVVFSSSSGEAKVSGIWFSSPKLR
jgi:hypothetical protein